MQTSIAQIAALTIYGNAFLLRPSAVADFYPANSTFQHCEYINFLDLRKDGGKWIEEPFAADPLAWFAALRKQEIDTLRMQYGPSGQTQAADRELVGFVGGGGRWLIEAQRSGLSDFWEARWQVGDRNRADRKIWRVTYVRIAKDQPPILPQGLENLDKLSKEFEQNLVEIEEFARSQKIDNFANIFKSARARLHSDPPSSDQYHSDLTRPEFLPPSACQLLAACQDAWVFGGMGSWNDQSFDAATQPRYEVLSEKLYQLLNRVVIMAANASSYGTLT
ncbi:MAG: hypothetical protein WAM79_15730 [Candidatus Sulfotelmatobacter sp.]